MTCDRGRILTSPTKATPLTSFDLIRRREGTMIARLHLLLQSLCLAWYWSHATGQSQNSIVQFHGSGSSVQERCFWHIMETMRSQIKVPTWTTYRSISSGPGQEEFIGNLTHSFSDFGSSDFPLSKEQYAALIDAGQEIVHLPVLMGAIGIFHSVPLINDDQMSKATHLNLTSCLVARIFKGDIKDWTHQDIADINPTLRLPAQLDFYGKPKADQSYPIKVAHRGSGSASTFTFTSYLHKTCPEHWGADLVGAEITWPMAGSDNLFTVEGTSGMITTIHREPGTIGYSDAGAGIDEGLVEVALKMDQTTMKEAFFLTSQNALSKDGVAAALEGATFPSSGADDWSSVDVINQVEVSWIEVLLDAFMASSEI